MTTNNLRPSSIINHYEQYVIKESQRLKPSWSGLRRCGNYRVYRTKYHGWMDYIWVKLQKTSPRGPSFGPNLHSTIRKLSKMSLKITRDVLSKFWTACIHSLDSSKKNDVSSAPLERADMITASSAGPYCE
jgi:hypothetical protein